MENLDSNFNTMGEATPQRPEMLKIVSILSFIGIGLMILFGILMTFSLALSQETIDEIWPQIVASNPMFEDIESSVFFHTAGLMGLSFILFNLGSLIGVMMMWNLNKKGFYIYLAAEILVNFLPFDLGQEKGAGSYAMNIIIDGIFIALYAVNLKHMNGINKVEA